MKRIILLVLVMLGMTVLPATAETLGWGFVNATDVALRRGVQGERITRLPKDTCVWINDSRTDSDGSLWYEIRTGLHTDNANYDFSGWMKADFIDAGEKVWHNVVRIAASQNGLIALRSDGSTETAGKPIVAMDGSCWVSPKGWAAAYGNVIHVGVPYVGNQYHIVTENNEFVSSVNGLRVADGLAHAASCEYDTAGFDEAKLPAWKADAEIVAFRSGFAMKLNEPVATQLYIGVRADGSVDAQPASVAQALADWSEIIDVRIGDNFVLGLKNDGTVRVAAFGDGVALDVSSWKDVISIGAGLDWCVGLQKDGTLLFAGDHIFMNEGHTRK